MTLIRDILTLEAFVTPPRGGSARGGSAAPRRALVSREAPALAVKKNIQINSKRTKFFCNFLIVYSAYIPFVSMTLINLSKHNLT